MTDKFPGDFLAEFRALQQRVAGLEAELKRRGPLTQASAGWVLPNRSTPSTPTGGAHIYGSGGEVMVRTGGGQTFTVEPAPDPPQGAAVANPPVFNSPSAPASVTVAVYQELRDDCQSGLRHTLIQLMDSLRAAGLLDT